MFSKSYPTSTAPGTEVLMSEPSERAPFATGKKSVPSASGSSDYSYGSLSEGPSPTPKPEAKSQPSFSATARTSPINPSTMNKENLLSAIHTNTNRNFSNSDEYTQVQLKLFLHAVNKDATLDDLMTAGMRDVDEKKVERKPYKSTDSEFKTIMHLLAGDTNEPELRKTAAAKIRSVHIAWEAAKLEPRPTRAKVSGGGKFAPAKAEPAKTSHTPETDLLDFFSHPAAR